MVSCCGQAKDQPGVTNTQPFLGAGPGIIDSQPAYQPVLNYNNGFQPPSIPTPPVTHPPSHDHNTVSNGFQPPMREFGAASPPQQAGPTITATYNGQPQFRASSPFQQTGVPTSMSNFSNGSNYFNSINQSITRPASAQSPHSPPPQVNAPIPIQDEGKMSISIDFGVYTLYVTLCHPLILFRYNILWCCKF
jgi:hypothetical protein